MFPTRNEVNVVVLIIKRGHLKIDKQHKKA